MFLLRWRLQDTGSNFIRHWLTGAPHAVKLSWLPQRKHKKRVVNTRAQKVHARGRNRIDISCQFISFFLLFCKHVAISWSDARSSLSTAHVFAWLLGSFLASPRVITSANAVCYQRGWRSPRIHILTADSFIGIQQARADNDRVFLQTQASFGKFDRSEKTVWKILSYIFPSLSFIIKKNRTSSFIMKLKIRRMQLSSDISHLFSPLLHRLEKLKSITLGRCLSIHVYVSTYSIDSFLRIYEQQLWKVCRIRASFSMKISPPFGVRIVRVSSRSLSLLKSPVKIINVRICFILRHGA